MKTPVVCAVHGDALGGGLGIVAAADLAVVDPEARLGTPEIRVGLFPMVIMAALQRCVPRRALMEMILTGAMVSAADALRLGLVNRVSPAGKSVEVAVELASSIASRSSAVIGLGKSAFYRVSDMSYDDALAYLHTQLTLNLLTEDAMEGVSAFLERRDPMWRGR